MEEEMRTREERIQAVNNEIRALFGMPPFPEAITKCVCLHCVMSGPGEAHDKKAKEFCEKLTAILKNNGVNPGQVVMSAKSKGVTNFDFEDGEIWVPMGFRRFLPKEPLWHRGLSFDLLMEIVSGCTSSFDMQ